MKNLKGQAAMEYLMTYGWALLAIIIVIAALLYLNPFRAPELCLFQQQGFSCSEPNPQVYLSEPGNEVMMNVRIWNKLGKTVIVKGMACTDSQSAKFTPSDEAYESYSKTIPTGDYYDFKGAESITCYHADGSTEINDMSVNQEFRGRLFVWYNYVDDLDQTIQHEAQANVISLIVAQ
ncbi:MAG: hypothetical protein QXH30_00775 [Candidatus Bilamarchaeaceae archaeon]